MKPGIIISYLSAVTEVYVIYTVRILSAVLAAPSQKSQYTYFYPTFPPRSSGGSSLFSPNNILWEVAENKHIAGHCGKQDARFDGFTGLIQHAYTSFI